MTDWPAPTSSTSEPPGRRTSFAPRGDRLEGADADEGDVRLVVPDVRHQRRELGRLDVRRIRRRPGRTGPPGRPAWKSCSTSSIGRPVRSAFSRASSSASGDASIAVTRAPGCSSAIASAIAPVPVPTSSTCRLVDPAQQLEAPSNDYLGLRARDQRPPVDGQRQPAKAPLPEQIRDRLALARAARRGRGKRRAPPCSAAGRGRCRARSASCRACGRAAARRRGATSRTSARDARSLGAAPLRRSAADQAVAVSSARRRSSAWRASVKSSSPPGSTFSRLRVTFTR